MPSRPKKASSIEPKVAGSSPATTCSQPWWHGSGYTTVSPAVLSQSLSKSPSLEIPNAGAATKAGSSQADVDMDKGAAVSKDIQSSAAQSGIELDFKVSSINQSEMMENLKSAEKLETGKSELEHGSELYHKLKKLEEKEWIYQDYINTIAQKEVSFRLKWEDSEEKHDQIRKKLIEAEKRAEQAVSEKEVFAEKNKELEKHHSDLVRKVTQHSMNLEALAAAKCKNVELDGELAANKMKIEDFQLAVEAIRHEKEGLFKELEATKSQLQIKEKELQELQRKSEDISGEKNRITQELAEDEKKIKDSQLAIEAIHHEKEGLFKELEATKSQLQIKEKELQELQRKSEDISGEKNRITQELAENEKKIKDSQLAMEAIRHEKEGLFKELEATKSQLQIKENELQELQRKNEDISGEKNRLTQELVANETKIKESQEAMEVTHCEKDDIFKGLEATKSQLQSKEKELEVALYEKDMVQSMSDTMQLQENEPEHIVQPLRNRRRKKKNKMKRATSSSIKWATSSSIKWVLGAAVVLSVFIVGIFLLRTRYYAS